MSKLLMKTRLGLAVGLVGLAFSGAACVDSSADEIGAAAESLYSGNVIAVNQANFAREVLGSPVPFLLEVKMTGCPVCMAFAPVIERLADQVSGRARVGVLELREWPEFGSRFGITNVPTVIVFKNGRETRRQVGAVSEEMLTGLLAMP